MRLHLKKYDKVILFFFVAAVIGSYLIWTFEQRFDEKNWTENRSLRYKMADDIIDSDMLIGKTKDEVIALLGMPYKTNLYGKDNIAYSLGRPPTFSESKRNILIIDFQLGHVVLVIESTE